jgi:hypothetical protein
VLVQVFAVALGVVIGFGVSSWNERERQKSLLRATVGNIVAELSSNQTGMQQVRKEHARSAAALAALAIGARASRTITIQQGTKALAAGGQYRENIPLAIAWQIAQSDQGLTLLPYEDRYELAWVYQLQAVYYQAEERYQNSLFTVSAAPDGNYYFQAVDFANQAQEVIATESRLDDLYTTEIKHLRKQFEL